MAAVMKKTKSDREEMDEKASRLSNIARGELMAISRSIGRPEPEFELVPLAGYEFEIRRNPGYNLVARASTRYHNIDVFNGDALPAAERIADRFKSMGEPEYSITSFL